MTNEEQYIYVTYLQRKLMARDKMDKLHRKKKKLSEQALEGTVKWPIRVHGNGMRRTAIHYEKMRKKN